MRSVEEKLKSLLGDPIPLSHILRGKMKNDLETFNHIPMRLLGKKCETCMSCERKKCHFTKYRKFIKYPDCYAKRDE